MSDDGHHYTFGGFPGPYWEKKALQEKAERGEELTSGELITLIVEEKIEKADDRGNYYCEQCHDWHGPDWDDD